MRARSASRAASLRAWPSGLALADGGVQGDGGLGEAQLGGEALGLGDRALHGAGEVGRDHGGLGQVIEDVADHAWKLIGWGPADVGNARPQPVADGGDGLDSGLTATESEGLQVA